MNYFLLRVPQLRGHDRASSLLLNALTFAFLALFLTACSSGTLNRGGLNDQAGQNQQQFESIGTGTVKVALLLPLSATGNAGKTAKALKEAAELALFAYNNPDIILIPKDTQGSAAGANLAAQQAVSEGAQLVIGPLFAESVAAASAVTRQANVPMIAFSTDSNVAGRGVYLLSFLPESDISQIIGYAASQGKQSFAALLPNTSYGTLVEGAFQQAVARHGGRVVAIQRYPLDRQGMMEPAKRLAEVAKGNNPQADAILIPDGPNVVPSLAPLLALNGVKTSKVKLLGSGQWADERTLKETSIVGGWYPAPSPSGWADFSAKFQETYGTEPPRIASIAYDAVNLASALATLPPEQRFTPATLTNPNGFAGVDGIFRFRSSGLNDRGLAILEVRAGGQTKVLRDAPTAFGPESF